MHTSHIKLYLITVKIYFRLTFPKVYAETNLNLVQRAILFDSL
jgi:hypothetical protein